LRGVRGGACGERADVTARNVAALSGEPAHRLRDNIGQYESVSVLGRTAVFHSIECQDKAAGEIAGVQRAHRASAAAVMREVIILKELA
jgi:hypothetical protein